MIYTLKELKALVLADVNIAPTAENLHNNEFCGYLTTPFVKGQKVVYYFDGEREAARYLNGEPVKSFI